jgi:hypothetical protein
MMLKTSEINFILSSILFLLVAIAPAVASEAYQPKRIAPLLEPYRWQKINELTGKSCRAMQEGINESISKPINVDELEKAIKESAQLRIDANI